MSVERGGPVEDVQDDAAASGGRVAPTAGPFRTGRAIDPSIPSRCRFLLREADDGALDPGLAVDPANRCMAMVEPVEQSSRQQELVCLTAAHVNCPRYLRGLLLAGAAAPKPVREPISPAVIGASLVLAGALAASVGFLVVRGSFDLPLRSAQPSLVAVAPGASPSQPPDASSSPVLPGSPGPSPEPSPTASSPPPASPFVTPTPSAARTAAPAPSSDRYALLTRCPTTADCWIYVIRAGDNLRSIANYFGVSYERVLNMNPGIGDPATVRPGYRLRIPTPTR